MLVKNRNDTLANYSRGKKDVARADIVEKVSYLKKCVDERINAQIPMGDLPANVSAFLRWSADELTITNRGTFYQAHNEDQKIAAEALFKKIRTPPIIKSEADGYRYQIRNLKEQLSGLADENRSLRAQLDDMNAEMQLLERDKDKRIERLRSLIPKKGKITHI